MMSIKSGLYLLVVSLATAMLMSACVYRKHVSPVQLGDATGTKTGRACVRSYFHLITTGDASLHTAMEEAGITKIASVDREYTNIFFNLGYRRYCVIVTGE